MPTVKFLALIVYEALCRVKGPLVTSDAGLGRTRSGPVAAGGLGLLGRGDPEDVRLRQPFGIPPLDGEAGHDGQHQHRGHPGEHLERGRCPQSPAGPGHGPLAVPDLLTGHHGERPGGRAGCHAVPIGPRAPRRGPGPHPRHLAGLGEGPEVIRLGGHRGDDIGHRTRPDLGALGSRGSWRRPRGGCRGRRPGVDHLQGQRVPVEAEKGCVAPEGGEGQGLVGEGGQVTVLEGLELGDGPAEPVVDGQQIEAALFPGGPKRPADPLRRGARLLVVVVAAAGCPAALPDHVLSPDFPGAPSVPVHSYFSSHPGTN